MQPKQIDRFEILSPVGSNERGTVYRALDTQSNREVAIKLLSAQSLFTTSTQRKFTQQMAILKAITHSSILPIIYYGSEDNRPFIVTPLMVGNLTDKIEKQTYAIDEALNLCANVGDGLDVAASHNQFHLDLKPNNILFDSHGHPFISDLGLVQVINSLSAAKKPEVNPFYMSPEQVRRRKLTAEAHVYSLGAILFHMLTGEVLFTGASNLVASFKHTSENPRRIRTLRREVTKAFDAVLYRGLEKHPEERYPSCRIFVQQLRKAQGGAISPEQVYAETRREAPQGVPLQHAPRLSGMKPDQLVEIQRKIKPVIVIAILSAVLCLVFFAVMGMLLF
jgi:serine/threonine-protein kinase